jgi:hypothetical protein
MIIAEKPFENLIQTSAIMNQGFELNNKDKL